MDFGRRLVDEPLAVQHVEHRLAFGGTQRARRRRPGPRGGGGRRGTPTAIERGPGHADALTQRRRLAGRRDGLDGPHQSVSSSSRGVRGIPRISATFFWRVMIVSALVSAYHHRFGEVHGAETPGVADQHVSQTVVYDIPEPTRRWLARAAGSRRRLVTTRVPRAVKSRRAQQSVGHHGSGDSTGQDSYNTHYSGIPESQAHS